MLTSKILGLTKTLHLLNKNMIAEIFALSYNKGAKYEKGDFENEKNFCTYTHIHNHHLFSWSSHLL